MGNHNVQAISRAALEDDYQSLVARGRRVHHAEGGTL
jgi:hypothetical protein